MIGPVGAGLPTVVVVVLVLVVDRGMVPPVVVVVGNVDAGALKTPWFAGACTDEPLTMPTRGWRRCCPRCLARAIAGLRFRTRGAGRRCRCRCRSVPRRRCSPARVKRSLAASWRSRLPAPPRPCESVRWAAPVDLWSVPETMNANAPTQTPNDERMITSVRRRSATFRRLSRRLKSVLNRKGFTPSRLRSWEFRGTASPTVVTCHMTCSPAHTEITFAQHGSSLFQCPPRGRLNRCSILCARSNRLPGVKASHAVERAPTMRARRDWSERCPRVRIDRAC